MDIEDDPGRKNEGMLSVYRGSDSASGVLVAEYEIMNGTLPQSITSTTHQMTVKFSWKRAVHCEILSYCIKFTILVDAGPSEDSGFLALYHRIIYPGRKKESS